MGERDKGGGTGPPLAPQPVGLLTLAQAVAACEVTERIFSWVIHTEKIEKTRFGKRAVYTTEMIERVKAVLRAKDPEGKFRVRPERKNGPQKRTKKKLAAAAAAQS